MNKKPSKAASNETRLQFWYGPKVRLFSQRSPISTGIQILNRNLSETKAKSNILLGTRDNKQNIKFTNLIYKIVMLFLFENWPIYRVFGCYLISFAEQESSFKVYDKCPKNHVFKMHSFEKNAKEKV